MVALRERARARWVPESIRSRIVGPLARRWPSWLPGKGRVLGFLRSRHDGSYAERMPGGLRDEVVDRLLVPDLLPAGKPRARFAALLASAGGPLTRRMQQTDIASYLPGDILVKVDRASMAIGLETRAPLLDHELAEWRASRAGTASAGARESVARAEGFALDSPEGEAEPQAALVILNRRTGKLAEVFASHGEM